MIPRYQLIEELPGTELYRFDYRRDAETGSRIFVKTARGDPPRASEIDALRREGDLLTNLAIPGVPRLVDRTYRQSHTLMMADASGGPLPALIATTPRDIGLCLAIGVQLAAILAEFHAGGFVHGAIRPEVILWDAERAFAWLVDFSEARSPGSAPAASAALIRSVSRLTYASPEQTGRMNRAIDHRSDLYALGVVLYELLTGMPPFRSDDALELIHWHIAKTPLAPDAINASVPQPLSAIVMRLLSKSAEDRYRSAAGLCKDLEHCAHQWATRGDIPRFPLGLHDVGDQFIVAQKLYGRETEVATLLTAFNRVCEGTDARPAIMLVAGYSGIGKTSLIQELYKPIVRQRGYFISGKFDQVVRNIPLGALIQAFRALVRQLLTQSEERLARWRAEFEIVLGANGGVLAEVIPEIEFIIGKQPAPVPLGATEALNRFRMVFQNFVAALARPEHPLVIFLDDLQWADAATLSLLEPLLTTPEIRSLFLMGAYRDNDVDATHPLARALHELKAAGIDVQRVGLGPLRLADLTQLVRDTLQGELDHAEPLARLVLEKTGGNPFFVTQFLKALKEDGYIEFDTTRGHWTYRIGAVSAAPLTDNVIDLMTRKMLRLPRVAQRALTLAACIGNRFELQTLAIVSEQSTQAASEALEQAISEGLIVPEQHDFTGTGIHGEEDQAIAYAFLHDRVQQAAYALIPGNRKQNVHLAVARLLRSEATAETLDEKLFDIVHHLNLGRALLTEPSQRLDVAKLNLSAGRKAKSSTAFDAALGYFRTGMSLLAESPWQSDYELAFALHIEAAEGEYLCGHFDAADQQVAELLQHAATSLDKAKVYRLRSLQYEHVARYADAVTSARQGLALFNVVFPDSADEKAVALENEIAVIQSVLVGRSIASLEDLPTMSDPEVRMVMNIMTDIWASAYLLGDPVLARLLSATLVRLSLQFGNSEESAYGYVTHAITVGPVRGDYASAYEFGKLALSVNARFHDSRRRAKICQQFHAHVNFWRQPWHTCLPYAREACRSGLESGDFLYAAYGAGTEAWSALLATDDLARFVREYEPNVALIRKLKNTGFADALQLLLNWARALQGRTDTPLSLSSESFDEDEYVQTYRGNPFFTTFHAVAHLHLCYLMGEHHEAPRAASRAREVVYQLAGTLWPPVFEFWNALTLAANFPTATHEERATHLEEMWKARRSLAVLAENCPDNFLCKSLLVSAEVERIADRPLAALDFYEQAIGYASQTGTLPDLALANELCGRFRLARGQSRIAAMFIAEARGCYARWGARAKAEELDRRYSHLLADEAPMDEPQPAQAPFSTTHTASRSGLGELDLYSLMKAAQAIAVEVELDRLLGQLVRIAIENAGAERGSLVLEQNGEPMVRAEGAVDVPSVSVLDGMPLAQSTNLPASIVNYVRRTLEGIVLANAHADDRFSGDTYIQSQKPASVMCVPVLKQGRLIGTLYLENRIVHGAFTPERMEVVRLLSAEAAISLENAKLFDELKQEIHQRAQAEKSLRAALIEAEQLKGELEAENAHLRRDLIVNVSHDLRTPLTSLRGYVETLLLKGDSLSADERRSYLEVAARQSERLATLVDELFELAKLDFRGVQINVEPLPLGELAFDVVRKFELAAKAKGVSLDLDVVSGIPLIEADVGLLERVFDNLIANAIAHTPRGGRVEIGIAADNERVVVHVADTGSGIPAVHLPFVFDRFYRADQSRRAVSGGAGLGLAIAKRIVELHGGQITVESQPQAGSRFSFSLPVRKVVARSAA